jgi:hypothetical protein
MVVKGQLVWYTGQPRFFVGRERFGRSFFELLNPGAPAAGHHARPGGGGMTGPAGRDLDQLLAAWAQARRLPEADAERIRQAIVPAEPALPVTWWSEFNGKLSTAIARATATPAPALA